MSVEPYVSAAQRARVLCVAGIDDRRNRFFYVDAGTSSGCVLFRCLVFKRDHRIQLLHHAVTTASAYVLYVAADRKDVIYVAVVHVPNAMHVEYRTLLLRLYRQCGPFRPIVVPAHLRNGDALEPMPDLAVGGGHFGYAVDPYTVRTHTRMSELMQLAVYSNNRPHRVITRLAPAVVAQYNRNKPGVDNRTSALLLENQPVFSRMAPGVHMAMQLLSLAFANAFRMMQLVRLVRLTGVDVNSLEGAFDSDRSLANLLNRLRRGYSMKVGVSVARSSVTVGERQMGGAVVLRLFGVRRC